MSHAELITNTIGGEIKMMPKINNPQHIRVPDCMVDDKYKLDLKEPTGSGKNTIYNNLKEVKNQANYVALDVSECDLSIEEIDTYLDSAFHSKHLQFIEGVILIKDNKLIKIVRKSIKKPLSPPQNPGGRERRSLCISSISATKLNFNMVIVAKWLRHWIVNPTSRVQFSSITPN